MMTTIKEFAQKAVQQSKNEAKWLAIDKHGFVYAFSAKPVICGDAWNIPTFDDDLWCVAKFLPPQDFKTELYEIPKLLSDEIFDIKTEKI